MPVLLITRSPSVHDSVVPLCAAAGVGAEVCAEPSLSLAAWREADLVLVGDDLAGALVGLAPPRRTGVHVVGVGVGDAAFRHAVELGAASVVDLPTGEGWLSDELSDVGDAGGAETLLALANAAEDSTAEAVEAVARLGLGAGDAVIGVSASGTTPYTLAVAEAARARGARVIGIANLADSPLLAVADVAVLLDSGPELVAGSTRMGAATAQKIALNMISTLMGLRLGHVHDGYMVNLVADNAKLRGRAVRIVAAVSGAGEDAARTALDVTGGAVKPAILVAAGAGDEADRLLAASGGHLGPALAALRDGIAPSGSG